MKKILGLLIVGILLIGQTTAFVVNIHYNGNVKSYNIEDQSVQVQLSGDYTKSGNTYILNHDFNNVKVYYKDLNGNNQTLNTINDLYINGKSSISYTGNGYLQLNQASCSSNINIGVQKFDFTGSSNLGTGNIFSNFIENGFSVIGSNIPSFLTFGFYMILLLILLKLIKRFGGKKG